MEAKSEELVARKEEIDGEYETDIEGVKEHIQQLDDERSLEVRKRLLLLQLELFMAKRISDTWVGLLDDELSVQENNKRVDESELAIKILELEK